MNDTNDTNDTNAPTVVMVAHTGAWYWGTAVTYAVVFLAIVFYGFYTSLAGRPMFGRLHE